MMRLVLDADTGTATLEETVLAAASDAAMEALSGLLNEPFRVAPKCGVCGAEGARFVNVTVSVSAHTGEVTQTSDFVLACGDCCHKPVG